MRVTFLEELARIFQARFTRLGNVVPNESSGDSIALRLDIRGKTAIGAIEIGGC
jgi:hypothetical protein